MTVRTCLHRCTEISIFLRGGHCSAAVLQVFPGPCTAPQHHTSQPTNTPTHRSPTTHHTPRDAPNRARATFGFECHAFLPFLVPMPARKHAFSAAHSHAHARSLPSPRTLPLPTLPSAAAAAAARAPAPVPAPWALPFPHCAFPSGSRAPFPHVHSIHVPSRRSVSPRFSHLRHVPKLNLTPPRTCVLCPTGKQHLILACLCGIWGPSCPSSSCPVTTAALGSPRAHPASRLADTLPSPGSMTSECSVPCCPVRVPPCECGVRVSVQVSVGWLCARLVLPSLVNFWRPSPSQVQVRSNQEEPSRVAPISLLASSPLRPQYPFLHTIKANLTPPGFPFPFDQRPGSWSILTAWT